MPNILLWNETVNQWHLGIYSIYIGKLFYANGQSQA